MQTHTDVMIHIPKLTEDQQFSEIAEQIRALAGVFHFERMQVRPSIVLLVYDATKIRALNILDRIHKKGFSASLIGM
ncbi:MAG: hypothetical protein OEZ68_08885 [Gammaproteobacteria bacterium]|nr:hypothetical protein [Gammaproteobacteria bacterium]MDH5800902.1 hypothetical protein [Gammaproteobacteria bacterium]